MKSVILAERDVVELQERPKPKLVNPTDVLVRVTATSVCGSDLHLAAGHLTPELGFALGHEWVGVVEERGQSVTSIHVGDRVAGPAAPWCGACELCVAGQPQRCPRGGILGSGQMMGGLGGTQSEFLVVPWADSTLVVVPEEVTDRQALTAGDVLSTGWTGVRQAWRDGTNHIVIIGCGPVGLSAIIAAKHMGAASVIAIDRVPERLDVARTLGATHTLLACDSTGQDLDALLPQGATGVVDAAGTQGSFDLAARVVSIGGRLAILGIPAGPLQVKLNDLLMKNVTLWTGLGDLSHMPDIMKLIAQGAIDPTPMFSHDISLDDVPAMYRRMASGDPNVVKVFVHI